MSNPTIGPTTRAARCLCGAVQVIAVGEPTAVVMCHCQDCQRRTGSVFGVGAYWPLKKVSTSGAVMQFTRVADSGADFIARFCPRCGTSVYWSTDRHPDSLGVAVGCFADPTFPAPMRSVWEQTRHVWVTLAKEIAHFVRGRA